MILLNFTIFLVFFSLGSPFYPAGCRIHFNYFMKSTEFSFNYFNYAIEVPSFPAYDSLM